MKFRSSAYKMGWFRGLPLLLLLLLALVRRSSGWACTPIETRTIFSFTGRTMVLMSQNMPEITVRFAVQGSLPLVVNFMDVLRNSGVTYEVGVASSGELTLEKDGVVRNRTDLAVGPLHHLIYVWVRFRRSDGSIAFGFEGEPRPTLQWKDPGFSMPSFCKFVGSALWITNCDEPEPEPPLACRMTISTHNYDFAAKYPVDSESIKSPDGSEAVVIRFMVRASRDAFLRLIGSGDSPNHYELDLNFSGKISLQKGPNYVATVPHVNSVSPTELRLFTIVAEGNLFKLYEGTNSTLPILAYHDTSPITIKYLSFASMSHTPVLWVHGCQGVYPTPPMVLGAKEGRPMEPLRPINVPDAPVLAINVSTERAPEGCMVLHTFKYRFDAFFAISEAGKVEGTTSVMALSVKARKDVHLHFVSSIPPNEDKYYEVDLDFFNHTNLERGKENKVVSVQQAKLLSPDELRTFIIRHDSATGVFSITKSSGATVLTWRDPNPFPLRYFSLSSGSSAGNDTTWVFGCPSRNSTQHQRERLVSGCSQSVHTHVYAHSQYFSVARYGERNGDIITIRFFVRAKSSAHIRLEPMLPPLTDAAYEVDLSHQNHTSIDMNGNQVITVQTGTLISVDNMTGFWIRQDMKKHVIAVGRDGTNESLVEWSAPQSLVSQFKPFAYFSLASSRLAGNGTWIIGCKGNGAVPSEEEASFDGQVDEELAAPRLLKRLTASYQPPRLSHNRLPDLTLRLSIAKLGLVDELGGIQVRGHLKSEWHDPALSWNPSEYDNLTYLIVEMGQIWTPDFVVYNGFGVLGGIVKVQHLGDVSWDAAVVLESPCEMQARHWPKDEHQCDVHVGLWASADRVNVRLASPQLEVDKSATTPSWDLLSASVRAGRQPTPWLASGWSGGHNTTFTLSVAVRRSAGISEQLTLAPFVVLAALCLLAYWVRDPAGGDKSALGVASLVVLVLSIIVLHAACPPGMHGLPVTVELYCACLVVVAMSLCLSVLMRALARESPWRSPPHLVCVCITAKPVLWLISVCGGEVDLRPGAPSDTICAVGYERGSSQAYVRSLGEDDCSCMESTCVKQAILEAHHYWHLLERASERLSSLVCWAMLIAAAFCTS